MKINLFDDSSWASLRPLTYTRPVADLRLGILTIAEKWAKYAGHVPGFLTADYLSVKYAAHHDADTFVNGAICPDEALFEAISDLRSGEVLLKDTLVLAYRVNAGEAITPAQYAGLRPKGYTGSFTHIVYPEDIFRNNDTELRADFELLTKGRSSGRLSATNTILGDQIFLEEGAEAECATFNTLNGPVYIGQNAQVWEGSHIRGSFALCHGSNVKMGSKIYGQTTVGPYSTVGGELKNAVIWGYSAKGHEGYLGNSVMGQWCNIGADSNNSNLKNNYADVKLWDYEQRSYRNTGLQFCGLIMADHVKCGINSMFNTGTVAGVGSNVFGGGYPANFIPDFSWGCTKETEVYKLNKMFETTEKVFERRNIEFNQIEKDILAKIFELTEIYRQS
ncbi:UDP-N-acetylglucosamine diphosphorylase/glucosamine-1-phosphate N-acetyltransferase [Pedobacter westerhofensis]|uniref:UDP-N-acetylglucosamine diphosphorylase/glucosamine-1-phosphate N-acetyltransferase n=1 Tax=Pedobacter westerhofensis TaxID=425512 RepID=A0A521AS84_9SPHI|nr:putative sugar nucleotidyl transferase [Pedobacter westerhofensis]SMO37500.1 UDP-N-acetylglucosamine diphosphorylase/glucosamine-1-phosphate N-acetyltransferase [Pedobacter westerhofensis]